MSFFNKLRGEFIDIIEWTDDSRDVMVYRFERHNNEIKNGAKLTVRESQAAVFVDEGQLADVFTPGMHTLETANLPILSTLKGWKYGFNSPFKAEVYFVNTRRFPDMKWGTTNPIMMRDADFGIVRVRAFGTYSLRVKDPAKFLKEVVGTNWEFTTDDISGQCRSFLVAGFSDALGQAKIPVLDLVGRYGEMGRTLTPAIQEKFDEYGLELLNLTIENVSVPPEVEAAIDTRSKMGAMGDLQKFTQFQAAQSLTENPGGVGAMGAQMAAGMAIGQQMMAGMQAPAPQAAPAPPPAPPALAVHVVVNGAAAGPYDVSALRAMIGGGQLTRDSLVWMAGMAEWSPAGQVPSVSSLFGAAPPPVPPSS
jgi:membrane protease subunit (stomatin/prohibitin family)